MNFRGNRGGVVRLGWEGEEGLPFVGIADLGGGSGFGDSEDRVFALVKDTGKKIRFLQVDGLGLQ